MSASLGTSGDPLCHGGAAALGLPPPVPPDLDGPRHRVSRGLAGPALGLPVLCPVRGRRHAVGARGRRPPPLLLLDRPGPPGGRVRRAPPPPAPGRLGGLA